MNRMDSAFNDAVLARLHEMVAERKIEDLETALAVRHVFDKFMNMQAHRFFEEIVKGVAEKTTGLRYDGSDASINSKGKCWEWRRDDWPKELKICLEFEGTMTGLSLGLYWNLGTSVISDSNGTNSMLSQGK